MINRIAAPSERPSHWLAVQWLRQLADVLEQRKPTEITSLSLLFYLLNEWEVYHGELSACRSGFRDMNRVSRHQREIETIKRVVNSVWETVNEEQPTPAKDIEALRQAARTLDGCTTREEIKY